MDIIYDFLYKDSVRISSLYSQLFEGLLLNIEQVSEERGLNSGGMKGRIPFVEFSGNESKETRNSRKEIVDPYDIKTLDVISKLIELSNTNENIAVLRNGYLIFLDKEILKLLFDSFDLLSQIPEEFGFSSKEKKEIGKFKKILKNFKTMIPKLPIQPAFLFIDQQQKVYGGTLREEFLSEPITAYYFKHKLYWLKNISIIGLKENAENLNLLSQDHLQPTINPILEAISSIIFPPNTTIITPIVIARRITAQLPTSQ